MVFLLFDADFEINIIFILYNKMQQLYCIFNKPSRWLTLKAWSGTAGVRNR